MAQADELLSNSGSGPALRGGLLQLCSLPNVIDDQPVCLPAWDAAAGIVGAST